MKSAYEMTHKQLSLAAIAAIVSFAILLTGCTMTGVGSSAVPSDADPSPNPAVTITGVVKDVSPAAGLVVLTEPVEGFEIVVLTGESKMLSPDGGRIAVEGIHPGMTIQVSGRAGGAAAMVVDQLRVLEAEAPTSEAPVETAATEAPPISITGIVTSVFVSARVIVLAEPAEGFTYVALTDETEIVSDDGSAATLLDVKRGMNIRATGHPGGPDALIAARLLLVGSGTPEPTGEPVTAPQEIRLDSPLEGEIVASPVEVRGSVSVVPFEATLIARVYDTQGDVVGEAPFMVDGELGGPGTFTALISYEAPSGGPGRVEVVDISARDGSVIASVTVGVVLSSGISEVSVTGAVSEVFPNARVITLVEPVDGFSLVALTGATEIFSADGSEISVGEIRPGMQIQAAGRAGPAETLIASQVRILAE